MGKVPSYPLFMALSFHLRLPIVLLPGHEQRMQLGTGNAVKTNSHESQQIRPALPRAPPRPGRQAAKAESPHAKLSAKEGRRRDAEKLGLYP